MRSWLRQHSYAIQVALLRIRQAPFSSIANTLVLAFVISLPLIAASLLISLEPVTRTVSVNPAITLFMNEHTSLDQTQQLADRLKQEQAAILAEVEVVDKNDALEALRDTPAWAEALNVLPHNPLPHAIILTLDINEQELLQSDEVLSLVAHFDSLEHVDLVQFDSEWVRHLSALVTLVHVVLILLAIGVAVVVISTVFNTVRMQALVQREEIAVARLVGATETFVRRPFLYFGAIVGFIAACLAIGLSALALALVNRVLSTIAQNYEYALRLHLPDVAWLMLSVALAMLISAVAARWSVTRHTRF